MPATSGWATRSSASAPSRRRTKAPRLSSSPLPRDIEEMPRGSTRSSAIRSLPRSVNSDEVTNGRIAVGASSWKPSGSGCSRPPCQTKTLRKRSSVRTSRCSTPRRRHSASAHGFSDRKESGPASTRKPSTRSLTMVPPSRSRASISVSSSGVCRSRASSVSRCAAANPLMPPPTTTTFIAGTFIAGPASPARFVGGLFQERRGPVPLRRASR